jgi:hypothetical protein
MPIKRQQVTTGGGTTITELTIDPAVSIALWMCTVKLTLI